MVTLYKLHYNENPRCLALRIARKGTVQVRGYLVRLHEEEVSEDTVFEIYGGEKLKYNDFMDRYGKEVRNG